MNSLLTNLMIVSDNVVINGCYCFIQSHILAKYLPDGYLPCGSAHNEVINVAMELIQSLQHNSLTKVKTLLLHGPRGMYIQ